MKYNVSMFVQLIDCKITHTFIIRAKLWELIRQAKNAYTTNDTKKSGIMVLKSSIITINKFFN